MNLSFLYINIVFLLIGFTAVHFSKAKVKGWEAFIMQIAVGMAIFPFLLIVLSAIHIPLHFLTVLLITTTYPIILLTKKDSRKKLKLWIVGLCAKDKYKVSAKALVIWTLVAISFLAHLTVYVQGAYSYPYLEDDDPWYHSLGTLYVAQEKTLHQEASNKFAKYLAPYPPGYDAVMGIIRQTNDSTQDTLKFFNSYFISLSVLFVFFMAKRLFSSSLTGLFASIILTIIPSYQSHFIFAQSYAIVLFFPIFWVCWHLKEFKFTEESKSTIVNKFKEVFRYKQGPLNLVIVLSLCLAGLFVVQPSVSFIILFMFCLAALVFFLKKEKVWRAMAVSAVLGIIFSMVFWAPILLDNDKYDSEISASITKSSDVLAGKEFTLQLGAQYGPFSLKQFYRAPKNSLIDQHIGLGPVLFVLLIASLVVILARPRKLISQSNLLIVLSWILFCFLGVQGRWFPINLMPHRFWTPFALITTFIVAYGLITFWRTKLNWTIKVPFLIALAIALVITSGYPKYVMETSLWVPGANKWSSPEQLDGYEQLNERYDNLVVYPLCSKDFAVTGFDQISYGWIKEVREYRENWWEKDIDELYSFLTRYGYEGLILDSNCFTVRYGFNPGNEEIAVKYLNRLQEDKRFFPEMSVNGWALLRVL